MINVRHQHGGILRAVALAMVMMALVVKVGVPPGFMISSAAGGALTPCEAQSSAHMAHAAWASGAVAPHGKQDAGKAPVNGRKAVNCAFSAHASAFDVPTSFVPPAPSATYESVDPTLELRTPAHRRETQVRATGPPSA